MLVRSALLLILVSNILSPAFAGDRYALFGRSNFVDDAANDIDDPRGSGFFVTYGAKIDSAFSLEISYGRYEFDDYEQDIIIDDDEVTAFIQGKTESKEIAILLREEVENLSPFLMVGHMEYDTKDSTIRLISDQLGLDVIEAGSRKSETFFGFGVDYNVPDKPYGIRASYKSVGGDLDIEFTSIAGIIRF